MARLLPLLFLLLFVSSVALPAQTTPDTLAVAPDTRARYAEDLDELERMKEKFRQQQERKARERDRGGDLRGTWTDPTVEEQAPPAPASVNPRDTVQLRSSVRSGLYTPSSEPALDERTNWERRMQRDLPREEPVDADEAARLDAEYAQQLAELEALRAKLRESRGEAPVAAPPVFEPTAVTAKSPAAGNAVPAGVTFITNTAYPNAAGYDALDALAEQVRASTGVVEIRVHTARKLDARAAQLLSEERAVTIRSHLLEAGIARENFRVVGYGNHESAAGERVEVITQ
ncbi:OmpA family protein [Neolewinella sp.]|uniref:OmpA family protein n=1 Tax=Neolewinella sp. TaxID=2993543 RepID=UPI003B52A2F4